MLECAIPFSFDRFHIDAMKRFESIWKHRCHATGAAPSGLERRIAANRQNPVPANAAAHRNTAATLRPALISR
ncbi:hypothetical protein DR62_06325 [Burkholderia thailandensis]|uniref:Uncharacterized protein n=1 Tax=Burkholderia thailandensis TaxID=57975 RepID=A0AAW9CUH3_BURTH|nr:hypothetical protein DR62_06325 [Burkholderia thailandensis]AOI52695.1 hypothetical protein WI24_13425 [Burkholderia thailandensis]AOJ51689.1 hypothetical protein AQ475_13305 [Burkholderia thailandensis]AOJ56021.1 hypothetical protein AQ477_05460 [Burkholderia thailandensis]AVR24029.1 hypothetical protein A8H32_01830 [Burkholderia thailandensis]